MKLDALRFRNLGAFGADGVVVEGLHPGLNVIAERNERGKSSLLAGLELLLFEKHGSFNARVKGLSRDNGASPEGEIDFTYDDTEYRLIKRFRTGKAADLMDRKTGQIIARRGEAEERLADMLGAGDKAKGPSGLLWVRQGTSMSPISDDGHVAARLETELSTLVGGDRARDYLRQVEGRLAVYRTAKGHPKKHGPIDLAQQALDAAIAELESAERTARDTREINRALDEVTKTLNKLEADYNPEEISAKIKARQDSLTNARAASAKCRAAQSDVKRLEGLAKQATEALTVFNKACAARDELEKDKASFTSELSKLGQSHAEAKAAFDTATQAVNDLYEAKERAAEQDKLRRDQERLSDRNAQLHTMRDTLGAIETKEAMRAKLIAERGAIPNITQDDLDHYFDLKRQGDDIDAQYEQLSVPLVFQAEGDGTITLDGQPVKGGPLTLSAGSTLAIKGVGTLRLDHPDTQYLDRKAAHIRDQIATWFETFEISTARQASTHMQARADIDRELVQITAELRAAAPNGTDYITDQKDRLEKEVEILAARLDGMEALSPLKADQTSDQLLQLGTARAHADAAREHLSDLAAQQATLKEKLRGAERGLELSAQETEPTKRETHRATLTTEALKADKAAAQAQEALDDLEAQTSEDPEMIEAEIDRLTTIKANHDKERQALIIRKAELDTERKTAFERRDPDADVQRLTELVEQHCAELARHEREADALTLLRETLIESQQQLQDHYTAPVRKELLPLLRQVIDGADLVLSEQLGATGLVRDGQDDTLERLSGGTQEQIAVLTRLAFARLLARGGQPCPVILDDALVYADDQRRDQMFTVLNHVANGENGLQLLYLSCHESATRGLGGHRLTLERWAAT